MCRYLPYINRLFVVFALVVGRNTTDSELHAMDAIVTLVRSFFLGLGVTGACDVVSVMRPSPCARLPHTVSLGKKRLGLALTCSYDI
jgi:hypothetical protein